jgi:hypothetical protein
MISLNEEPLRLTSTFRAYRNDIDIYTEDNAKNKEFYKVLFKRLLKNEIIINDITPLGCKDSVIKRCNEEPENGRKKIFIVDGDITFIHGNNIPAHKHLYILEGYCIENFLIDKETIIHFMYMNCGTKPIEQIESELNYNDWLNEYSTMFIDLFIHFALINYYGGYFTLFNANKYHVKEGEEMVFKTELVKADILKTKEDILKLVSFEDYNLKYQDLTSKWSNSIENLTTIVSGKDYLIPLLLLKTKQFKKSKAIPTLEEIKFSLVHSSSLNKLSNLKKAIENL